jgi:DNA-binding NarL/FixJ family response regulator
MHSMHIIQHADRATTDRRPPAVPETSPTPQRPLRMALLSDDPITAEGAEAYLRTLGTVRALPPERHVDAEVILLLTCHFTSACMTELEQVTRASSAEDVPVVLVCDSISQGHLTRAISHGLTSYLVRSRTTLEEAVRAALDSRSGATYFPDHLIRGLIDQTRSGTSGPAGLDREKLLVAGLSARETEVLALFAEGLSTADVARQLSYAERTIKNVLHGVLLRLGLRNRAHAVAYMLRANSV